MTEKDRILKKTSTGSQVFVDMTGPRARVASLETFSSSIDNSNSDGPTGVFPELRHNLRLLVGLTEEEIHKVDRERRHAEGALIELTLQRKRLDKIIQNEDEAIERMTTVMTLIDKCQERLAEIASQGNSVIERLDTVSQLVELLCTEFSETWDNFGISALAEAMAWPLMKALIHTWEPMISKVTDAQNSKYTIKTEIIVAIFSRWKLVLVDHDKYKKIKENLQRKKNDNSITNSNLYDKMINQIVLPKIRSTMTSAWKPRNYKAVIPSLKILRPILSKNVLYTILSQLILPKLQHEVQNWNPRRDTIPVHSWIHPWQEVIPDDMMQPIYQIVRYKLSVVLQEWHPSDSSALTVISPWQSVWRESDFDTFVIRSIVPKLIRVLSSEFTVDPQKQYADPFQWVMRWESVVPQQDMVRILSVHFFPKWFTALYTWLDGQPNFEEVSGWYLGWKSLLPDSLKEHAQIKNMFNKGLDLMNEAVSGKPLGTLMNEIRSVLQGKPKRVKLRVKSDPMSSKSSIDRDEDKMTFKEAIQRFATINNVIFVPNLKRGLYDGQQIYTFGEVSIYLDKECIYIFQPNELGVGVGEWKPIALEDLLARGRNSEIGVQWGKK